MTMNWLRREPEVPATVSDKDWAALQDRARKANPRLDSLTDPEAVRRRLAAGRQHDQRDQS